jgi:hypothetical protein
MKKLYSEIFITKDSGDSGKLKENDQYFHDVIEFIIIAIDHLLNMFLKLRIKK